MDFQQILGIVHPKNLGTMNELIFKDFSLEKSLIRSPKALGLWLFDGANAHVEQSRTGSCVFFHGPGVFTRHTRWWFQIP